jgi:hypothetical protein
MIRILLEFLLPLVLPTLVYAGWMALEKRRAERLGKGEAPSWREAPWVWLSLAGVVLAALLLFGLALMRDTGNAKGQYVPPRMEKDGRIVPGHVEPRGAQR